LSRTIPVRKKPTLITFKRALAVPFFAAAAILPMLPGQASAAAQPPASAQSPAAATEAAVTTAAAGAARASQTPASQTPAGRAAVPATKHHHHPPKKGRHRTRRLKAYIWAAHQRGKWYCWGGTGGCFDCSGLVMSAYRAEGLNIGRDTIDMLDSGKLVQVSQRYARKGDLAFFGTGHVELYVSRKYTYGALHSGTQVGWHRITQWWHPTMYFRVKGA
jgi:cell wall-associated NlpC family hydrolase